MQVFHIPGPAPYYTNTFLLLGDNGHAVAIDPAAPAASYEEILQKHGAQLTHILLTHGHHDHVAAVQALQQAYQAQVRLGAGDARENRLFPLPQGTAGTYIDGEIIQVDDMSFTVIATPGHSQGCVCLLCGDLLFTGDTLFAGDCGRTDLEGSDPQQMLQSLQKLYGIAPATAQVLPGHDVFSTVAAERQHNPYFKA